MLCFSNWLLRMSGKARWVALFHSSKRPPPSQQFNNDASIACTTLCQLFDGGNHFDDIGVNAGGCYKNREQRQCNCISRRSTGIHSHQHVADAGLTRPTPQLSCLGPCLAIEMLQRAGQKNLVNIGNNLPKVQHEVGLTTTIKEKRSTFMCWRQLSSMNDTNVPGVIICLRCQRRTSVYKS